MANALEWYYSIGGQQCGPVTAAELKQLVQTRMIGPDDLVWKDGMAERRPAGKVKGLFPVASTPSNVGPPLPPSNAEGSDIASAAKGLFGAIAGAAKRTGSRVLASAEPTVKATRRAVGKATDTAKSDQEKLPRTSTPAYKSGRRKKGFLIVGGVVAVGFIGFIGIVATLIFFLLGKPTNLGEPTNGEPKLKGDAVELRAFADLPQPVKKAVDAGDEVWELTGWQQVPSLKIMGILDASLYVVLEQGNMKSMFQKVRYGKGETSRSGKQLPADREVVEWSEYPIDWQMPEGKQTFKAEFHWRLQAQTPSRYALTEKNVSEGDTADITTTSTYTVVIDEKVKEGYWKGESNTHVKNRGRMAKFPDRDERKVIDGLAVKILGRRPALTPVAKPPKPGP